MRPTPYRETKSTLTAWIVGATVVAAGLLVPDVSSAVEVNSARPRLFITPSDLPLIRARIEVTDGNNQSTYPSQWGTHNTDYGELATFVITHPGFEESDNDGDEYFDVIVIGAFMYLVEGNTEGAEKALDVWLDMVNDSGSGVRANNLGHTNSYYYAAAYDWLYDYMSPSQRTQLGQWLLDAVNLLENDGFLDPADVNDGDHAYHGSYHSSAVLTMLLALYGSGVASDSWFLERITYYDEYKSVDFASHYNQYGYGSYAGYAQYILIPDVMGAWAMQSAMNRDLFAAGYAWSYDGESRYVRTPEFLEGIGLWVLSTHRSDMTESEQPGDGYYSEGNPAVQASRTHHLMYKLSQEFDQPFLKWFTDGPYADKRGCYGVGQMWKVVADDLTDPGDPNAWPDLVQLNCDRDQQGFGCGSHHVMRSSWDFLGSDYPHVLVTGGNTAPHWRLASFGSYDVSFGSWMMTGQTAAYDATSSVHFEEYNRKTWAFNLVDVGGRGYNRQTSQQTTRYIRSVERDDYRALYMDLTQTLPNPDNDGDPIVATTYREVGQLSDRFVCVFDRIVALDGQDEKVVNIHAYSVDPPELLDGSWDGGTAENAFGGTPGRTSSNATQFSWPGVNPADPMNDTGPQLMTTVTCPTEFSLRKVGGPNSEGTWNIGDPSLLVDIDQSDWGTTEGIYELWSTEDLSGGLGQEDISFECYNRTSLRNYPWHERGFRQLNLSGNTGRWRIEVIPETGREEDVVLVVHEILPSPGQGTPVAEVFSFEQGDSGLPQFVGAQIGNTEGWVVMYNVGDEPATAVSYETQGALVPELHRISGVKPGLYEVAVDGIVRLEVESVVDENFLSFAVRGHRIEVRPIYLTSIKN